MSPKLRAMRRHLDREVKRTHQRLAQLGRPISCGGAGCNGCCRGTVETMAEEVPSILAALDDAAWERVAAAAPAMRSRPETTMCPLLDPETGGCSVYEVRPATCRVYGVVSPRDWCWPERVGTKPVARPEMLLMLLKPEIAGHQIVILGSELLAEMEKRCA